MQKKNLATDNKFVKSSYISLYILKKNWITMRWTYTYTITKETNKTDNKVKQSKTVDK